MRKYHVITLVVLIAGCAVSRRFQPDENNLAMMQQKVPGVTMEGLREGMVIYKRHCASCHQLYPPSAFDHQKWGKSLNEMFPKARIIDQEVQQKIRNYVYAMCK